MFRKYHMIVLNDENEVDPLTKLAANHRLQCLYKIGVYGKERQHELYVVGSFWEYQKFLRKARPKEKKVNWKRGGKHGLFAFICLKGERIWTN